MTGGCHFPSEYVENQHYNVAPPSDVRWFINPMNYSYRYHKPVRDIGVINAPTERTFVNGGSFHSLNASWDRSSGHREKRSGIHQRKSWVTV